MNCRGLTLIELIISLVVLSLMSVLAGRLLTAPWQAYEQNQQRTLLVQQATQVLNKLEREVRQAVPNTLRVSADGQQLEFFYASAIGRYRDLGSQQFNPARTTSDIQILSDWQKLPFNADQSQIQQPESYQLVLNNTSNGHQLAGQFYYDWVKGGDIGVINPKGGILSIGLCPSSRCNDTSPVYQISLTPHRFVWRQGIDSECASPGCIAGSPLGSQSRRIYLTDGPRLYQCQGEQLFVSQGYSGQLEIDDYPIPVGALSGLVQNQIEACDFQYQPGNLQRAALVTLRLDLYHPDAGRVRLLRQIQVVNAP